MTTRPSRRSRVGSPRTVLVGAVLAAATLATFAASVGRLRLLVLDEDGKPLSGVAVRATFTGTGQSRGGETDADGRATLTGLPGGENIARFEKSGYQILEKNLRILVGGTEEMEVALKRLAAPVAPEQMSPEQQRQHAGIAALNDAAKRFEAGDLDGAQASLRTALDNDGALAPAHVLQARIASRRGDSGQAADSLIRALQIDPSQSALIPGLVVELQRAGRTAEAAEYEKKLGPTGSESPTHLYNMAIVKINAGDDDAADKLLRSALDLDPRHAPSVYQAGMIAMRRGDIPRTKQCLALYLEIDPQGEFSADAREILKAFGGA